ncbi:hypothetical protein SDJN02_24853, partial [Cucurbita argyrosperma subsp. argyrosperma]
MALIGIVVGVEVKYQSAKGNLEAKKHEAQSLTRHLTSRVTVHGVDISGGDGRHDPFETRLCMVLFDRGSFKRTMQAEGENFGGIYDGWGVAGTAIVA